MIHALTDSVFLPCNNTDEAHKDYPETFYLDHLRLTSLSHEASDILALYMLLMLYRQLSCVSKNRAPTNDTELEAIKREIKEIGPARLGRCFSVDSDSANNRSKTPPVAAAPSKSKAKSGGSTAEEWNTRIADVLLQLAARATVSATSPREQLPPGKQTLSLLDGWTASNLRPNSSLSELLKMRLKGALFEIVGDVVLSKRPTSGGVTGERTRSHNGAGLEVLTTELRVLGEKIANLAICHWRVYGALYEADGFLTAGGF